MVDVSDERAEDHEQRIEDAAEDGHVPDQTQVLYHAERLGRPGDAASGLAGARAQLEEVGDLFRDALYQLNLAAGAAGHDDDAHDADDHVEALDDGAAHAVQGVDAAVDLGAVPGLLDFLNGFRATNYNQE